VPEDPSTGSAAAAFAGPACCVGPMHGEGDHTVRIEQGYEMNPSFSSLASSLRGGKLVSATVGAAAVTVTQGVVSA